MPPTVVWVASGERASYSGAMSYVIAICALAVLIVVHEAGHMWVARWCRMRVDRFSIFFGPPLLQWRGKHTTYQLASIPLGGFVQIAGMNPRDGTAEDDPSSYMNRPAWQRFLTIAAGPSINYLFAIVLMLVVAFVWGVPARLITVGAVSKGSPAAVAGMKSGDVIQAIDGKKLDDVGDVIALVTASEGQPVQVRVHREGKTLTLPMTPQKMDGVYRIGIRFGMGMDFRRVGVGAAVVESVSYPVVQSGRILKGLGQLVTRKVSTKQVGGPIEIVHQISMSFQAGFGVALMFLAMINVYLGLFNLLPLPALDGGRLAFLVAEIVSRRRVDQRIETIVHTIGFVLLFGLLLLVTYADIRRRLF